MLESPLLNIFYFHLFVVVYFETAAVSVATTTAKLPVTSTTIHANKLKEVAQLQNNRKSIKDSKCENGSEWIPTMEGPPKCCQQCAQGEGMLQLCTQKNGTECRPCTSGIDYSDTSSAMDKCKPCTLCSDLHPDAVTIQNCEPTSDTVCECPPNWYLSIFESICKPCSQCNSQYEEIVIKCSTNNDNICRPCQPGHYLKSGKCAPCSSCSSDHIEVAKCNLTQDTVCCPPGNSKCLSDANRLKSNMSPVPGRENGEMDRDSNSYAPKSNSASSSSSSSSFSGSIRSGDWRQFIHYGPSTNDSERANKSHHLQQTIPSPTSGASEFIPLYCALMGLVIFSLVLYVIYKHWARYRQVKGSKHCLSKRDATANNGRGDGQGLISEKNVSYATGYTPLMMQSVRNTPTDGQSKNNPYPRHDHRKLNSLPESTLAVVKDVLTNANNGNGWKDLAKELGYSPAEVYAISTPASVTYSHMSNPQTNGDTDYRSGRECVEALLCDWMVRDCATVARFTRALQRAHLQDVVATVIAENDRVISPSIVPSSSQFSPMPPSSLSSSVLPFTSASAC